MTCQSMPYNRRVTLVLGRRPARLSRWSRFCRRGIGRLCRFVGMDAVYTKEQKVIRRIRIALGNDVQSRLTDIRA